MSHQNYQPSPCDTTFSTSDQLNSVDLFGAAGRLTNAQQIGKQSSLERGPKKANPSSAGQNSSPDFPKNNNQAQVKDCTSFYMSIVNGGLLQVGGVSIPLLICPIQDDRMQV